MRILEIYTSLLESKATEMQGLSMLRKAGIEKQNISRLFERFYRVDQSRSREQGGSGLGLSIVKHIIESHNEQIFVKSEYGKGSEFSFTLEK